MGVSNFENIVAMVEHLPAMEQVILSNLRLVVLLILVTSTMVLARAMTALGTVLALVNGLVLGMVYACLVSYLLPLVLI